MAFFNVYLFLLQVKVSGIQRELNLSNVQCKFDAENFAAEQNFQVSYFFYLAFLFNFATNYFILFIV